MDAETVRSSLAYLTSGLLITNGIRAILDPVSVSQTYGIPITENTTSSYVPVMGARNIMTGLSIGSLLYAGYRQAPGAILSTALLLGPLDAWFVYRHTGQVDSGVVSHVVGDGLAGVLGLWLLSTTERFVKLG